MSIQIKHRLRSLIFSIYDAADEALAVPVVEDVASPFDEGVGVDDEVLSVHTAQTDDIRSENHLQPAEVIEMETPWSTSYNFRCAVSAERGSASAVKGSKAFEGPDNLDDIYVTPAPEVSDQIRLVEHALGAGIEGVEPAMVTISRGTEDIRVEGV